MKKFLTTALLMLSSIVYADVPKEINVYSSAISGAKTNICRAIFDDYSKIYNTKVTFIIKPGAEGLIATKEMFQDKTFTLLCGGPSETIFNNFVYPGNEDLHSKLKTLTLVSVGPISFTTRVENTSNNLIDLLKVKNSINIGYHSNAMKFIVENSIKTVNINWIPFKAAGDSIPSLLNGDIDFYISSGSLEQLTRAGKLKSLGYVNGPDTTMGDDLTRYFPTMSMMPIFISIGVFDKTDIKIIEELNKRLNPIIFNNKTVNDIYNKTQQMPFAKSYVESNQIVDDFRKIVKENYKK